MSLGEFDLIARFFSRTPVRGDVLLGVGDDAALLAPPPGQALVAATDTLVEGRHFLPGTPPECIGHQALAVNLSDLAAMGAEPAWALLSLSLPEAQAAWLEQFANGLYGLAERHGVALVGGDTVRGPFVVTIAVLGFVPAALALRRDRARVGDFVYVSGTPGVAAAGLELLQAGAADFTSNDARVQRFLHAEPRLALGYALRGVANSAMDVSDGLLGDLGKLCSASHVAARIDLESLPVTALEHAYTRAECERLVLRGGDDYELLFTVSPMQAESAMQAAAASGCTIHRIGEIIAAQAVLAGGNVTCLRNGQVVFTGSSSGYDHFAG